MKITFECDLKEIVEAAIICQEQCEKSEQSAQKESPGRIIAAILRRNDRVCREPAKGV